MSLECLPLLQVNVGHPSEVDEIFDAISYSKGASVIRMLHNYIGDEVGCPSLTFPFSRFLKSSLPYFLFYLVIGL